MRVRFGLHQPCLSHIARRSASFGSDRITQAGVSSETEAASMVVGTSLFHAAFSFVARLEGGATLVVAGSEVPCLTGSDTRLGGELEARRFASQSRNTASHARRSLSTSAGILLGVEATSLMLLLLHEGETEADERRAIGSAESVASAVDTVSTLISSTAGCAGGFILKTWR